VSAAADARPEILLRGNVRPAVGLAVATTVVIVAAAALVAAAAPPAWLAWILAALAALCLGVIGSVAWLASRPRVVRRGGHLEVRTGPFAVERVPLGLVECVFPGSQPLGHDEAAGDATHRVTTLIVRLAERATAWRRRPGAAWVTWDDGAIVVDGRWCEPLSPAFVRGFAARLIEIKREAGETEA
jgi:hypothetical protein